MWKGLPFLFWFAVGVPWYWSATDTPTPLWLGVPRWAAVSVLASFGVSLTIAWQLRQPFSAERSDVSAAKQHNGGGSQAEEHH